MPKPHNTTWPPSIPLPSPPSVIHSLTFCLPPVNNLGPQTSFPVPQGILNYYGTNHIALTLWSQETTGARLGAFQLVANAVVQSAVQDPGLSPAPAWSERVGAY